MRWVGSSCYFCDISEEAGSRDGGRVKARHHPRKVVLRDPLF